MCSPSPKAPTSSPRPPFCARKGCAGCRSHSTVPKLVERAAAVAVGQVAVEEVSIDTIRIAAFQKWETAGKPEGDGVNFWLDAEQELHCRCKNCKTGEICSPRHLVRVVEVGHELRVNRQGVWEETPALGQTIDGKQRCIDWQFRIGDARIKLESVSTKLPVQPTLDMHPRISSLIRAEIIPARRRGFDLFRLSRPRDRAWVIQERQAIDGGVWQGHFQRGLGH